MRWWGRRGGVEEELDKPKGAMEIIGYLNDSEARLALFILVTPGGTVSRARLRLATVGATVVLCSIRYGWIYTVVSSWSLRRSLAKVRTFLSSGVALAKEGVKNCNPQSTRM